MGYVVLVVRRSSTNGTCCCSCSKELNQWDLLLEYASVKGNANPHLVLESAWRVPNWTLMKDALAQVRYPLVNPHGQFNTVIVTWNMDHVILSLTWFTSHSVTLKKVECDDYHIYWLIHQIFANRFTQCPIASTMCNVCMYVCILYSYKIHVQRRKYTTV